MLQTHTHVSLYVEGGYRQGGVCVCVGGGVVGEWGVLASGGGGVE